MTVTTQKFVRKPFYVDGVQVTEENLEEVAQWCGGRVITVSGGVEGAPPKQFIDVRVQRPLNPRQHQGYPGDWILSFQGQFKVYTPKAFEKSFDSVFQESDDSAEELVRNIFEDQGEEDKPEELLTVDEVAEELDASTEEVEESVEPGTDDTPETDYANGEEAQAALIDEGATQVGVTPFRGNVI